MRCGAGVVYQARAYWEANSLPVIGEDPDAATAAIGAGASDSLRKRGTFWNRYCDGSIIVIVVPV